MRGTTLEHRALADPSRTRLLARLRAVEEPQTVDALASYAGLHPNTVRAHLELLEQAALVVATVEQPRGPGRPRRLFAAVAEDEEQEHRLLAAALASALEPLDDGESIAAVAGRSWGRALVDRLEPGLEPGELVCVERVASLLRRRGFAPTTAPGQLVMHRCPFRELAERYPGVVCALHAGLIDGALEELGAPIRLDGLQRWATPTTCVARFAPRDAEVGART